ncbi:unnamed protein product [Spirodela intermedia]|uniref:Uncharacterized protein n=1 Tax=Spirodela intermedia TaxID=51605 RepID=A0A7I8JH81_SPIIN|nr:unnamed protein product [Spirodela intermedia]CAA6669484.1 unnamed protein product [Spirodela intermedia]
MPPGALSLDDVDLDQVSIDFVLNCVKKGEMLDLSEAIRVQYDSFDYPSMDTVGPVQDFFLTTTPESSGHAPSRAPPPLPSGPRPSLTSLSPSPMTRSLSSLPVETKLSPPNGTNLSKSQSIHSANHQELTVDDIEDFEDDEVEEEVNSLLMPRWNRMMPPICMSDDDLRETAYEILVASAGAAGGLIVPSKEKKKEKKSRLLRKLARSRSDNIVEQRAPGLVGLLETMRIQLEYMLNVFERTAHLRPEILNFRLRCSLLCFICHYDLYCKTLYIQSTSFADSGLFIFTWAMRAAGDRGSSIRHGKLRFQRRSGRRGKMEKDALSCCKMYCNFLLKIFISEAMDIRTRQGLLNALVGKVGKRMDTLLVPLELLCCVSRTEFSDKKAFLRWQKRQLNMLEEGLINHPVVGFGESGRKANDLRILLRKIEESEVMYKISERYHYCTCGKASTWRFNRDVCHWADGYHLNVLIYEKMLLSVFDILDEGKLTEEVEEILELLKSTWRILGITETIHDTCYSWVLFRQFLAHKQFVITGEQRMLQVAIQQLRRIPAKEQRGPQERLHLKSLRSKIKTDEGTRDFTFLQSFLLPIQKWTDKKLGDYHLHFPEGTTLMPEILTAAVIVRRLVVEESEQVSNAVETRAETAQEHVLACLAEDSVKLLKRDATMFLPILSERHPQAPVASASIIHKLYGNKLRPFLDRVEHLTEDVVSVLPAAATLEQYIMSLISSACEEELVEDYCMEKLSPYQVESISGTLVMRWVNAQLGRISSWVQRAIQQERWEPISPQQRHGSSVVEVYRIIEETVDQFFDLKVPMRVGELNSLLRGFDNTFKEYTQHIVGKIASKEDLIPPVPILTRYKKEIGIKALVRKEIPNYQLPDERKSSQINILSTPVLCVQLNTLHYTVAQLNKLEDNIQERWMIKIHKRSIAEKSKASSSPQKTRAFDGSRKDINAAIDRLCEFMGTKIVFWDMREMFIENLYRNGVSHSRLDTVIEGLDKTTRELSNLIGKIYGIQYELKNLICERKQLSESAWNGKDECCNRWTMHWDGWCNIEGCIGKLPEQELNQLCEIIVDPLRDRSVTGLLQASVNGLVRVLLDGGTSRIFFPSDAKLLEEDLETLKEFFVSGGDGLPRGTVENLVSRTRALIEELRGMSQGSRSRVGADSETLIRILCHRSDSEASQFLKKQYKIPKSAA